MNAGIYWWGSVESGQLSFGKDFLSGDYFKIRVDMLQPEIIDVVVTNGEPVLPLIGHNPLVNIILYQEL